MAIPNQSVEESICEKWSETRSTLTEYLKDGESYVRVEPLKAVAFAAAAGYVLRMLPLGLIFTGIIRILLAAIKPAALVYGAAKSYEVIARPKNEQQDLL